MSKQQLPLPLTSTFLEAMDDVNNSQKLNPKVNQPLINMGIKKDDSLPICTITQEKIDYKDCVKTSCGHYFSCEEFWQWTKQSNKCPNCREELIQRDRSEELALKNLMDRRREIREQVRNAYEELDTIKRKMEDTRATIKLKRKCVDELLEEEDELIDSNVEMKRKLDSNREIFDEMRLYNTNRSQWEKRMKRRERLIIQRGKEKWRTDMKNIHKELITRYWLIKTAYLRKEPKIEEDEEIDFSELNMFKLPPEFEGAEIRVSMCLMDRDNEGEDGAVPLRRVVLQQGEVDEINWDSYDYYYGEPAEEESGPDMSVDVDYSDMPELVESPIVTSPQSPGNVTTTPIIRSYQSLNPQQFRELFNRIQPINGSMS